MTTVRGVVKPASGQLRRAFFPASAAEAIVCAVGGALPARRPSCNDRYSLERVEQLDHPAAHRSCAAGWSNC